MFIQDFIYYLQAPKYVGVIQGIEQSDDVTTIVVTGSVITEVAENTKVRIQGASSAFNGIYTVNKEDLIEEIGVLSEDKQDELKDFYCSVIAG